MTESSAAREIHPIKDFRGNGITKDFSIKRVEEEPTSAPVVEDPKEESARESAPSSPSIPTTEQIVSGTPAQTPASKENGPDSEKTEDDTSEQTNPSPETSSPDSSLPPSPGWSTPPVPVTPPTSEKTQKP